MNPFTLLALAAMTLVDPTGDAFGDGELTAPTSPVYANTAIFDLQELRLEPLGNGRAVELVEQTPLNGATVLRLTMGALDRGFETANGFSGLIVDVYLDTGEGGNELTMEGPGMALPAGRGWEYAVRLAPDMAYAVAATAGRAGPELAELENEGGLLEAAAAAAEPLRLPLALQVEGNTLVVGLPWLLPQGTAAYALAGVYDPFSPSGWRPLAATPSPWAFTGGEQRVPVIDLFAQSQALQQRALRSGEIVETRGPPGGGLGGTLWLILMIAGVLVAAYGLWQRSRGAPAKPLTTGLPPEPGAGAAAREPQRTGLPAMPASGVAQRELLRTGAPPEAAAGGTAPEPLGAGLSSEPAVGGAAREVRRAGLPPEPVAVVSLRPTAPPPKYRDAASLDDFFQADEEAERREAAVEDPAQVWGKRPAPLGLKVETGEAGSQPSEAAANEAVSQAIEAAATTGQPSGTAAAAEQPNETAPSETQVAEVEDEEEAGERPA